MGEARRVEGGIGDVEPQEPLEEQVVLESLAELAFRTDRVERHQERPF